MFFNFNVFARGELGFQLTGGAWAPARITISPSVPHDGGCGSPRRPMHKPIPAVFPSVGSCRPVRALIFYVFHFNVKKFPPRSLELAIFVGIFEGGIEGGRVDAAEAGYAEVTPFAGLIKR